jgi:hypothetical protein
LIPKPEIVDGNKANPKKYAAVNVDSLKNNSYTYIT